MVIPPQSGCVRVGPARAMAPDLSARRIGAGIDLGSMLAEGGAPGLNRSPSVTRYRHVSPGTYSPADAAPAWARSQSVM